MHPTSHPSSADVGSVSAITRHSNFYIIDASKES